MRGPCGPGAQAWASEAIIPGVARRRGVSERKSARLWHDMAQKYGPEVRALLDNDCSLVKVPCGIWN